MISLIVTSPDFSNYAASIYFATITTFNLAEFLHASGDLLITPSVNILEIVGE